MLLTLLLLSMALQDNIQCINLQDKCMNLQGNLTNLQEQCMNLQASA